MKIVSNVARYKSLLEQYTEVIREPNWHIHVILLKRKMDRLWVLLNQVERQEVVDYADELYQAVLKDNGHEQAVLRVQC